MTPATKTGTMKRDHAYGFEVDHDSTETENVGPFYNFDLMNIGKKKKRSRFSLFARDIKAAVFAFWNAGGR